jgi:hypothetical protein
MHRFSILTNRKRAAVALVHSVIFLLIAVRQMVAATPTAGIWTTLDRGPGNVDSLRNLRGGFLNLIVAVPDLAWVDGAILLCLLHHQRDRRLAADCGWRSDVSHRALCASGHAGERGRDRRGDCSEAFQRVGDG